jgi:beta-lactamase superfamily II metal-dependent hydrolase
MDFMDAVNAEGAQVYEVHRRDRITLSDLTFYVLHLTLPLGSDGYENSTVLKLPFGQIDLLFTGDVESEVEANMVAAGLIDDIDILKGTIVVGTDADYLRCWTYQSSVTGNASVGRSMQDRPG